MHPACQRCRGKRRYEKSRLEVGPSQRCEARHKRRERCHRGTQQRRHRQVLAVIIVETIEDAYRLAKGCKDIKEINLGGTRKSPETTLHPTPAIFATETDAEHIQELVNDGVVIEIRQVPNDSKVFAKDVF